jgi:hypothetical protein
MYAGQCRRHSPARTTAVALLRSAGFCLVPQQPCSHQHGKQAHSSSQLPVWRPSLRRQGPGQRKNKLRSSEVDRSEENRNQRSGYSPRRSSGVVRLCEQPVDDCLAAHPLRFLIIFPSHPHLEKLVHELADGCGAQIAALSAREQEFGIAARDLEERRRPSEVVAAREPARDKPVVLCGMTAGAAVPPRHIELRVRDRREDSLQLLKRLHVHGDLQEPPPSRV